ncbi:MAG: MBL fold metallo-hydrolase [Candidatus Dormibacteria bacterium]
MPERPPSRVERVRAPNAGPLTGPGTNTWMYGEGAEVVVIDPGPRDSGHLERVARRAQARGPVLAVAVTHHHPDHLEGAAELGVMVGAPLARFHEVAAGDDLGLHHGDRLLAGSGQLVALYTPGHASDHLCFWDPEKRLLFTGDHVLQGTTSVVAPPDGDMARYLESLEHLGQLAPRWLLPGHGEPIEDGQTAITALLAHRRDREQQILAHLREAPRSAAELVPELYSDYPKEVWRQAEQTVLAHLLKLEQEGRARRVGRAKQPRFSARRAERTRARRGGGRAGGPGSES